MLAQYAFDVIGHLCLSGTREFSHGDRKYEFAVDSEGFLSKLIVSVPIDPNKHLPMVTDSREPGVKANINVPPEPHLRFLQMEMRVIEGLLSLYGVREIPVREVEIEWIPESIQEKQMLKISSMKMSIGSMRDITKSPIPFDLVARSILMATDAMEVEVPLSFYRKGCIDMEEVRYIDAIYDFYFVLESQYSGGKTKNYAVKNEFLKSNDLRTAIQKTINTAHRIPNQNSLEKSYLKEHYLTKSVSDVIDHLIKLRGFLHHHTPKHPDAWHPEGHEKYRIDAFVIQEITNNVCFNLFAKHVLSDKSIEKYEKIFDQNS